MKLTCGTLLCSALILSSAPQASAQGVPVIDSASIARMVVEFNEMLRQTGLMNDGLAAELEQIGQGVERAAQLEAQIGQLQQQIDAITGSRDVSGILEGFDALDGLLPTTSLPALSGDTSAAAGLAGDMAELDDLEEGAALWGQARAGTRLAMSYEDAREAAFIENASAQTLIENMDEIDAAYDTLIGRIDVSTDLKASLDLSARIAAENGRAINRLAHMLAISSLAASAERRKAFAEEESIKVFDDADYSAAVSSMIKFPE